MPRRPVPGRTHQDINPDASRSFVMKKLVLAMAVVLVAAPALAQESAAPPETIYNPNVALPSSDDVHPLRMLQPNTGFPDGLHLDRLLTRSFDNEWMSPRQEN
jgi:hypothetical protein